MDMLGQLNKGTIQRIFKIQQIQKVIIKELVLELKKI